MNIELQLKQECNDYFLEYFLHVISPREVV